MRKIQEKHQEVHMKINERRIEDIKAHSIRFDSTDDLSDIVSKASEADFVLLGEATHGTSEFYKIRAELTKKLIAEKGFSFVAVEGDWPSCFLVNQYIKGYDQGQLLDPFSHFNRWPTWMWANEEVSDFINWLKNFNSKQPNKIGFYGMDVYSLWESMEEIIRQLEKLSPTHVESARKAFACFEPFNREAESYAVSAAFYGEDCTEEVINTLVDLQKNKYKYNGSEEQGLNIDINSLVMLNAERYYRAMAKGGPDSWNIRDHHMVTALEKMREYYPRGAKCIVWEHNTHIGDARATDMVDEGLVNVGQLLREKYGEKVYAVGFGTHRGKVIAAREWGGKVEELEVPKARSGSFESLLHESGAYNKYMMFNDENRNIFNDIIGHRAIGVVYNPEVEHLGNYVPTRVADRYDSFIFVDETSALSPLFTKTLV